MFKKFNCIQFLGQLKVFRELEDYANCFKSCLWKLEENATFCLYTVYEDFPGGPVVKTSPSNTESVGLIPGQRAYIPRKC